MLLITAEEFKQNYDLEIDDLIETRPGSFQAKYLSWANAQNLLRYRHPKLAVQLELSPEGTPIFQHGDQAYIMPFITDGEIKTPPIFYPVMTHAFNPLSDPSVTDINKAIQRATAKVIAVYTGIGLKLYVGEDLPDEDNNTTDWKNDRQRYNSVQQENAKHQAPEDWQSYLIPMGKHQGKSLAEIMETEPTYVTGYLLSSKFEFKSESFENACKAAAAATGATAADIETEASEKKQDEDLDEEVPF